MKQVNDELDAMRKAEKRAAMSLENKAEKDRILEGLNKSKYSFIKNEDSLNETQKEKLKSAQEVSPILSKMHQLKFCTKSLFFNNHQTASCIFSDAWVGLRDRTAKIIV